MYLATKTLLPSLHVNTLARERLFEALDLGRANPTRLILLSAPPGYGKTTLLAGWVRARRLACAWLSLDADDNDPGQFCLLLLRALEPHLPDVGDLLLLLGLPQALNHASVVAEIINRAARAEQDLLVVFDDFHVIAAPAVQDLVRLLLTHLPPRWRLVVLTREDPPLNLAQLRARRQLREVRARDLAFSREEGGALLGAGLSDEHVVALVARTEGWAAGLHLAGLALADRPDAAAFVSNFDGSHRFVLDYLAAEVLDRLPPDLRIFLCRAAVLDRFTADLCDVAFARPGSARQIARAEAANLFLQPLDEQGRWFRLHRLMRDVLAAEIPPDERRAIARRASLWFWGQGGGDEAVVLALVSGDFELAAEQVEQVALGTAEQGRLTTVLGWIERLPEPVLWARPDLCVYRAWMLVFNGRFQEARDWISRLREHAPALAPAQEGLLVGMECWLQTITGQRLDLGRLQAAYAQIGDQYASFAPTMLLAIGQAQREAGDYDGALRSFAEGARRSTGAVTELILHNNQAFLLDALGRRAEAQDLVRADVERFAGPDGRPGLLAGIPLIAHGIFQADSGEPAAAYETLTRAIHCARRLGLFDVLAGPATYQLQFVLADLDRLDDALALNAESQARARRVGLASIADQLAALAAWLALGHGRPERAEAWTRAHPLDETIQGRLDRSVLVLLQARMLAAGGAVDEALALLEPRVAHAGRVGQRTLWVREGLEVVRLRATRGRREEAESLLGELVVAGAAMGYRQIFRRNVAALAPLLPAVRAHAPSFVDNVMTPVTAPPTSPRLIEPLGERELEIVRLLAAGLSNAEIAERLFLAPATIKWYLSQTYAKLGARRRTEAVASARDLGLI